MTLDLAERQRMFEKALLDVLALDYDLEVHGSGDSDRRSAHSAELLFEYRHEPSSSKVRVIVRVEAVPEIASVLHVDLGCEEALQRSAEDCEGLILQLTEHLAVARENEYLDAAAGHRPYGRREDDLAG